MKETCFWMVIVLCSFVPSCRTNKENPDGDKAKADSLAMVAGKPKNIGKNASIVNLGSREDPIYEWMEYKGVLNGRLLKDFFAGGIAVSAADEEAFPDLHLFTSYDRRGTQQWSYIYEVFEGDKTFVVNQKDFEILGAGGATMVLRNNGKEYVLCWILNTKSIPVTRANTKQVNVQQVGRGLYRDAPDDYASNGSVYLTIVAKKGFYEITIDDEVDAPSTKRYKLHCGDKVNIDLVRYYNPKSDTIHLLNRNCYFYRFP